jgi:hypothetical protein
VAVLNAMQLLLMGFNNLTWKQKYVSSISLYFLLGIGPSRPGVIYRHFAESAAHG